MEKFREYWADEIKENLLFTINDVLTISKEIEWSLVWVKINDKNPIRISLRWKTYIRMPYIWIPYIFTELSNYFYEQDFVNVPLNYLNSLYKLLLELRGLWKKIESLSDNDKISILDFVLEMISFREKQVWEDFCFPQNYKDLIMIELGLDIVDKVWDATNETLALLDVIMLKR
jgi:hypothetical protein